MIVKQNSYTTEKFRVLFCTDIPIPECHIVKFDNWLIELCEKLDTSSSNTQYFFIPNSGNSIEVIFDIERFDKK
jgi:hypothetical protein